MEHRLYLKADRQETVQSLLSRRPGLSRRQISRLKFLDRGLLVNDRPVRSVDAVQPGDVVSLYLYDSGQRKNLPCQILYEDDLLLVADKPAGKVVHPAPGHEGDSLQTELEAALGHPLFLKGRLDKDTSGILVFGKADWVPSLTRTEKTYLAICEGHPVDGEISVPLGLEDRKMVPDPAGKSAWTRFQCLRRLPEATLLKVTIRQGRMHQIRAHMAAIGHPLVQDPLYGHGFKEGRTLLHCACVHLVHPVSHRRMVISACLPEDFAVHLSVSSE